MPVPLFRERAISIRNQPAQSPRPALGKARQSGFTTTRRGGGKRGTGPRPPAPGPRYCLCREIGAGCLSPFSVSEPYQSGTSRRRARPFARQSSSERFHHHAAPAEEKRGLAPGPHRPRHCLCREIGAGSLSPFSVSEPYQSGTSRRRARALRSAKLVRAVSPPRGARRRKKGTGTRPPPPASLPLQRDWGRVPVPLFRERAG